MKVDSEPLVSVVTPVYNEEGHLAECIESVLAQSYQNWEYIIGDNCSTDRSLEIARSYAARDRRIRVLDNTEFVAALPNFNRTLRQISPNSKYCKVVLGDDWIFPECLSRMVATAEAFPSVGVVGAYALEGVQVTLTGLPYRSQMVSGRDACRAHLLDRLFVFGSQTSVLYRADLVRSRDRFYDESRGYADTDVCFALLKDSDFGFVHQVLTYTRVRPGSMNTVSLSLETSRAAWLYLLLQYGSSYLTPNELETRLTQELADYYRFLGKSLLLGRDKAFWNYHRQQLTDVGLGYSSVRVAGGLVSTILEAVLNPRSSITAFLKRRRPQSDDVPMAAGS